MLPSGKRHVHDPGPVALQEHGDPVRFRNIWIRNIREEEKP